MTADKLPCPFCGGTDIRTFWGGTQGVIYAGCSTCSADGPEVRHRWTNTSIDEEGDAKAIAAWNRRAALTASNATGVPIEARVRAIVTWLDANQPDVWRRGLWDAINAAGRPPAEAADTPIQQEQPPSDPAR